MRVCVRIFAAHKQNAELEIEGEESLCLSSQPEIGNLVQCARPGGCNLCVLRR